MTQNVRRRNRSITAVAALSICAIAAGGTYAYASTTAAAGPAKSADIPQLKSIQDVAFPLDAYEVSPTDMARLTNAMRSSLSDCMGRFGFTDYPKEKLKAQTRPFPKDRQYLFIDPAKVAEYGYAGGPMAEISDKALNSESSAKAAAKPSPEEVSVYLGKGQQVYRGAQVPEGGCLGEARRAVLNGAGTEDEWVVTQLRGQASEQAEKDARVVGATQRWSACMARSGYSYKDPGAAWEDPRWSDRRNGGPLTSEEKAVATADMNCKLETNYLGARYVADKDAQNTLIAANVGRLNKFKTDNGIKLKNAQKILGE
ncbi:hypothetical protein [Nonomuraea sp. NPDC049695]|uniref:hypothetical protein n=1 Tax=Nonomuraea sp. NPDC049695 TaxID=3154734 RepID=UPI0034414B40